MKNQSKLFLVLGFITIVLIGCSSPAPVVKNNTLKKNLYSTSEFVSHDTQGIVTLRGVSDEVNSREEGIKGAHKKAIRHLFYIGFPGTDMKNPMIQKGQIVESQNPAFFNDFWNSGYQQYIVTNTDEFFACSSNAAGCMVGVSTFKLNYNILRRDLERNKILNKIGF